MRQLSFREGRAALLDSETVTLICRTVFQSFFFALELITELAQFHEAIMYNSLTWQRLNAVYRSSHHFIPVRLLQPINASHSRAYAASTASLPRVAQPSIWHSIIPKAFRNPESSQVPAKPQRRKEWNPATFFICIFLLIGSNAIQMLTLKNDYSTFSRKADAKIKLLKDVLDRVQRGENVDVEKALGTGDEQQEQEWRDGKWLYESILTALRSSYRVSVLRDMEEEDRMWEAKDRRKGGKRLREEQKADADGAENVAEQGAAGDMDSGKVKATSNVVMRPSDFY